MLLSLLWKVYPLIEASQNPGPHLTIALLVLEDDLFHTMFAVYQGGGEEERLFDNSCW